MKLSRQNKIIELINEYEIGTQEELTNRLRESGYDTTQATVSRDINALKLKKIAGKNGQKYVVSDIKTADTNKYRRIFSDGLIRVDQAATIVVIKTISGMAMAVAAALDELKFPQIMGSIAGDDTIMCACRCEDEAKILIQEIQYLLKDISKS